MKVLLIAAVVTLAAPAAAIADGAADGNAGLEALNAGNFDQAITLFTRAINSHELSQDDKEFAIANRGRAYAKEGHIAEAIDDLDQARKFKPDDVDAQNDLVALLTTKLPADQIPGVPKAGFWKSLGQAMLEGAKAGVAAGLAGDDSQ
jgi:tetratricopeptide (TPR) repeat protein